MINQEEIEVLQTIYNHDLTISNTSPRWYGVMVATGEPHQYENENDNYVEQQYIHVLFHVPSGYPSIPVEIRVVTPVLITNSKTSKSLNIIDNDINIKEELEIILNLKAQEIANNEEFAMYEIVELARNWLWDNQRLSNTSLNFNHGWWVGELLNKIFNWQTNSYSPSKIMELQFRTELQVIEGIQGSCNVKVDIAKVRFFLMKNLWNVEKTIKAITKNISDINENNDNSNINIINLTIDNIDEKSCNICFDTFPSYEMITFVICNHCVCNECLIHYLSLKISENQVFTIGCPGDVNCPYFVDPITIGQLLSPKLVYKYYSCLRESFNQLQQHIEITKKSTLISQSTKKFSWCINPKCNHSLSQQNVDIIETTPSLLHCNGCTSTWCSSCEIMGGHWPSSCKDYEAYLLTNHSVKPLKIIKTEVLNITTKPCPNCRILIDKNGGCMHMTCRFCQYEFCWNCLVEWKLRTHSALFECDKQINENVETSFGVFDEDDFQLLPGSFQRKFKQGVIVHSQSIKKEQMDLDVLVKQYNNGSNTKNVRKLRIYITKLLIQINYIIKFASMGFFCKSNHDKNEIKKGIEILQRLEFGLRSLENVKEQIIEFEKDSFGKSKGNIFNTIDDEKRFKQLEDDIEQYKERLENNIKKLVKLLNYLDNLTI
ncbi:15794_t:CDS:1 [Gigaspora margarita]|uniref:RBR-type E3 ubiquitin transferase n=1 Tax=Gigaspora margarita TaxID=4874 RepID=A0ABM8W5Q7_GIGMA|nr:15794_t:CDS:1 [Gigaspora margarita]